MIDMRYLVDTVTSPAYWRYALFSLSGGKAVLAIYGAIWLLIECLDFFRLYTRDQYAPATFLFVILLSALLTVVLRRPIRSIEVTLLGSDCCLEVRIGDIFDASGAVMICTNTDFECDVAGGKIAPNSLQGQFTARYYTGDQHTLIQSIDKKLASLEGPPYTMGTTVPVTTHGKTFYFVAMAQLNEHGTASTTLSDVEQAMKGLWAHVRESGELQELIVPIVGTGRGRLSVSRKKVIEKIAESFAAASGNGKLAERLVIVVRPEDAKQFQVNLYEIKDRLAQVLEKPL